MISKTYTLNNTVSLTSNNIKNEKPMKVLQRAWLPKMFPDFESDLGNAANHAKDLTDESHQSRY